MSSDFYTLLSRYVGRSVCMTLHGQTNVWGRVAGVCFDGVRLVDTIVAGDLDGPGPFNSNSGGAPQPPPGIRSHETLIHVNQVLAVTCLDEDLPDPPADRDARQTHSNLLVEPIELSLGGELFRLVEDRNERAPLRDQVNRLRNQLASDLGLWLPEVRIRESTTLPAEEYRIKLRGVTASSGRIPAERVLALETVAPTKTITADPCEDTPFGVPGVWIERRQRELAEMYGYSVVTPTNVLVARLDQLFRDKAPEMFGRQQLEDLLDQVRSMSPALVEEVLPELIRPRQLLKVLRGLLREGVPVRDMETILEALPDALQDGGDPLELTERVRHALAPALTERYRDASGTLYAVTLDPTLESALARSVRHSARGRLLQVSSMQSESIVSSLSTRLAELRARGRPEVVLTNLQVRAPLRNLIAPRLPKCVVLSHEEIAPTARVASIGMVFYSALFASL